jgi:HEAT repeat protein
MTKLMPDPAPKHENSLPGGRRTDAPLGMELLPPVETPSAGFILQLFIVPALIVLMVVSVWLLFTWLVHRTSAQPEDLIQGLEGSGVARWQRASELAGMLSDKRYADFQTSAAAATKLAAILDREIDAANSEEGMQDESVTLRYFLCRALGEFRVPDGLDVLLKAATTNRDPKEESVRLGAIEAIAVRAFNLSHAEPPQPLANPELEPTLFRLASDDDPLVRSETAYALGQVGTPASLDRLEAVLEDAYPDARYNAAVALAHHGRAKAVATLVEMLEPAEAASSEGPADAQAANSDHALTMTSALAAAEDLAEKNPEADLAPLVKAIKKLISATAAPVQKDSAPSESAAAAKSEGLDVDPRVVAAAQHTLDVLEQKR